MEERLRFRVLITIIIFLVIYILASILDVLGVIAGAVKPLIYAFAIAYILDKMVKFIHEKTKLSRELSIGITIIIILLVIIFVLAVGIPSLVSAGSELVRTLSDESNYTEIIHFIESMESKYFIDISSYFQDAFSNIFRSVTDALAQLGDQVFKLAKGILGVTSQMIKFILAFVIAIYMLIDKRDLIIRIKRVLFAYFKYETTMKIIRIGDIADDIFSNFFIGKLLDSSIIGFLCYLFCNFLGIPYPLIISLIIGVTNMIPYVGPIIGAVPASIIVLIVAPSQFLVILLLIFALQQFDGLILGPIILGDKMKVSAFWIIIAVTIGGELKGFIGMLLGVPVLVLIKTIFEESVAHKLQDKSLTQISELKLIEKKKSAFVKKIANYLGLKKN